MKFVIQLPARPARKTGRQNTRFVGNQTEGSVMKTWTDGTQFAVLCEQGRVVYVKVQAVEGGYALYFCLNDKSREEEPVLKARTKTVRVWSKLDTLVNWIVENTSLKTLIISLEKPP